MVRTPARRLLRPKLLRGGLEPADYLLDEGFPVLVALLVVAALSFTTANPRANAPGAP